MEDVSDPAVSNRSGGKKKKPVVKKLKAPAAASNADSSVASSDRGKKVSHRPKAGKKKEAEKKL